MKSQDLTRRQTFGALAGGATLPALAPSQAAAATPAPACVLPVQVDEGPFYFDPALVRSDITEGLPGVPLALELILVDARSCTAMKSVRVDIWHADAIGRYSGFDRQKGSSARETFLRGTQTTDERGMVTFRTIYPGWYPGRTPHIHLKAFVEGNSTLTTQLYFPDALSEYIYEKVALYSGRDGARDTTNGSDGLLTHTDNGHATFLSVREAADAYVATLTIAVDRNGRPRSGWWPPAMLLGVMGRMASKPRTPGPLVPGI